MRPQVGRSVADAAVLGLQRGLLAFALVALALILMHWTTGGHDEITTPKHPSGQSLTP